MAEFILKNSYFQIKGIAKQQICGTAIGTTCAPTCGCFFMDQVETCFHKAQ